MKKDRLSAVGISWIVLWSVISVPLAGLADDTLPALKGQKAPHSFEELWSGFDPRAEPLDLECLKQWEEDGVVLKVLRYRIGVFKGKKAMMAAVYGYPKGGKRLPGLAQIHGGGQYADYRAPLTNAKRGYATISIAWAGRISAPGHTVNKKGVQLFWDGKTKDPAYRLTTDWGALDAYHAPCRNRGNNFANIKPHPWTLDPVESPRNNPWFLVCLGARRALTFLEQQGEVDKNRLGVYGHSMGGKLTVMTAGSDPRIKAAALSCGGLSNRNTGDALYDATIADDVYLKRISCPIVFLSPANDFHGRIDDLQIAMKEVKSRQWRLTCSPHHNHQDTAAYEVATQLWFDQFLRKDFTWPRTPASNLALKTPSGVPTFSVTSDTSRKILSVDIFYTQQGVAPEGRTRGWDRENAIHRFWHYAKPRKAGKQWTASLPVMSTEKPLWVYANVLYRLEEPIDGAGYYYGLYRAHHFNVSSAMSMASPEQLKQAGVRATLSPTLVIEDFQGDWKKEWFLYSNDPQAWQRRTHKVYDDRYKAPAFAKLSIEVRSQQPNKLVIGLDKSAAEIALSGGAGWQTVVLSPGDFKDTEGNSLRSWKGIKVLRLSDEERLRPQDGSKPITLGATWKGVPPEFRSLRWATGSRERVAQPVPTCQQP